MPAAQSALASEKLVSTETNSFDGADSLAHALAGQVAADLKAGIGSRGAATLAVSGGSTPKKFFAALSMEKLDWAKVTITLVDERWVDSSSDRSNAKLVADLLLQNDAKVAAFVPLFAGSDEPTSALVAKTNAALAALHLPFDAVILGMGNDGHTASFFPGGDTLHEALTSAGPALALRAPGAGEPRITLTLPFLLNSKAIYLHIEGPEKTATLAKAVATGPIEDMPIRAVIKQTQVAISIYSC
jgi:6-phosphogluconolactonase